MVLPAGASSFAAASVPWSFLAYVLLGLALLRRAGRLLHVMWWRPRRLERALRAQGLRGRPHSLLAGDVRENARVTREAWSRPLPLGCHDIAPRVVPFLRAVVREHGRRACLCWFGPVPRVIVADPGVARDVLSNKFGHLEKPTVPALTRLLAEGVAGLEGEKWVRHRRILNPAFHLDKLKSMLPAFSACCEELVGRWARPVRLAYQSPASSNFLSEKTSHQQPASSTFLSEQTSTSHQQSAKRTGRMQLAPTAVGASWMSGRSSRTSPETSFPAPRSAAATWRGGGSSSSRQSKVFADQKQQEDARDQQRGHLALTRIDREKNASYEGRSESGGKDDLLGLLLESNMRHTDEHGQSSLEMTTEDVVEECKLFYFAGMETTSVLLTWAMVLLSMHPEWQDRAREEVLGLFGRNKPEYDGLSKLKTVTMILHEVLRLYPPFTLISRKTYKEVEIGGVRYPAGVMVDLPVLLIHHDPDIWGGDVHEFRPDRFAEGVSGAPAAFFPFGWGPRTCIGQNFALLEAKMALSMILQRVRVRARAILHPRAAYRDHPAADAWSTD